MKKFFVGFAVLLLAILSTSSVMAADDAVPSKDVKTDAPKDMPTDLAAENAELKAKVKKLEADVKKLTPAPPPPPPPPQHWTFKFNLDLAFFSGNTEQTVLSDAFFLKYDSLEEWNLVMQTIHTLVMEEDNITEQFGYFMGKFEYAVTTWISPYATTKHGWQESQKMTYMGNIGLGGIWTFLKDPWDPKLFAKEPNYNHRFFATFLYEHKAYADSAGLAGQDNFRLQLGLDLTQWLAEDMVVGLFATWSPNFEDFEDWVLDALFWMEWVYDEFTKFRVSVQYVETKFVPVGVKTVDFILKVGMEIKLGW